MYINLVILDRVCTFSTAAHCCDDYVSVNTLLLRAHGVRTVDRCRSLCSTDSRTTWNISRAVHRGAVGEMLLKFVGGGDFQAPAY